MEKQRLKMSEKIENMGYGEALAEVEAILDAISRERTDVDTLAVSVARATKLIALCRSRLHAATTDIDKLIGKE